VKRFLKITSLVLAIVLVCAVPVCAEEEASSRTSAYFLAHDLYLSKKTSTKFQVHFDVDAMNIMDELGAKTIKVQRSPDGSTWTTMFTYSREYYPQMICENTGSHAAYVPYTGTVGYYYRAKVTFYAKNSNGSATYTLTTKKLLL